MCKVKKLIGIMSEKSISQDMLAQRMGLSRSTINRKLKTGEDFSIGEAKKMAEILGLSAKDAADIFFDSIVA